MDSLCEIKLTRDHVSFYTLEFSRNVSAKFSESNKAKSNLVLLTVVLTIWK